MRFPEGHNARAEAPLHSGAVTALRGIDPVQLAIPPGGLEVARGFWSDALGLDEVARPAGGREGAWFGGGSVRVHVAVEEPFRPAAFAHPALVTTDLRGLLASCPARGLGVVAIRPFDGRARTHVQDSFGKRVEPCVCQETQT